MSLRPGTDSFGHAFEHFIIQELVAYLNYTESTQRLSYWRTYSGQEVDAVLGDAKVAIELNRLKKSDLSIRKGYILLKRNILMHA